MSYRYKSANDLVDKVDFETQNFINEMPCIYADIKPLNQHINIDEIRADERKKVIDDVHKAMANKYHCKEDMCEVGMTCADCLKAYMEDLYSNK